MLCNFIEIALRHGCSPVNLLHVFKTLFSKNTSGWLLLNKSISNPEYDSKLLTRCSFHFFIVACYTVLVARYFLLVAFF